MNKPWSCSVSLGNLHQLHLESNKTTSRQQHPPKVVSSLVNASKCWDWLSQLPFFLPFYLKTWKTIIFLVQKIWLWGICIQVRSCKSDTCRGNSEHTGGSHLGGGKGGWAGMRTFRGYGSTRAVRVRCGGCSGCDLWATVRVMWPWNQ